MNAEEIVEIIKEYGLAIEDMEVMANVTAAAYAIVERLQADANLAKGKDLCWGCELVGALASARRKIDELSK